ncbi:MAG TPA: ATP-binding protein [Aliidongia sp.]|nr:ATP-binding protein [Aliidongia sp.]
MNRFRFGIAFRLLAGLTSLVLLTAGASGVSFLAFRTFRHALDDIGNQDLPALVSSAALVQQTQKLVATAPALMLADTQYERRSLVLRISGQTAAIGEEVDQLRKFGLSVDEADAISQIAANLVSGLHQLDQAVEQRIDQEHRLQDLNQEMRQVRARVHALEAGHKAAGGPDRLRALLAERAARSADAAALWDDELSLHSWLTLTDEILTLLLTASDAQNKAALDSIRQQLLALFERISPLGGHMSGQEQTSADSIVAQLKILALDKDGLLGVCAAQLDTARIEQIALSSNRLLADRLVSAVTGPQQKITAGALELSRQASDHAEHAVTRLIAIVAFCVLLAGLILLYISRSVIRRLRRLQSSMQAHIKGLDAPIDTRGRDEIGDIARALDFFVRTISEREADLRESESRFRALVEGSLQGIVIHRGLTVLFANEAFAEIVGAPTPRTVTSLGAILGSGEEDETEALALSYQALLESGGVHSPRQVVARRIDGGRIWLSLSDRVVEWIGAPAVQSTLIDITEQFLAQEALRVAKAQAEQALVELKAAQTSLIHAEKLASLGQLTAGIAHEIKNPLNFVNNFASLSLELFDELEEAMEAGDRAGVTELAGLVARNLGKIRDHGRRADGIVRSMLLHSRGGDNLREPVEINGLVEEALNLAFHGAKAQSSGLDIRFERHLDPALGTIEVVPQDVMRVFLNLFSNAFYAMTKRRIAEGAAYRPMISISSRERDGAIEVEVSDNGTGMSEEVRAKLFTPFFTTKPTGEGTGLGLSLSYDIIVHQHHGSLAIDSRLNDHTTVTVTLPRTWQAGEAAEPVAAAD